VWDLVVTMTASWQKVFSTQPAIGYWAQHTRYQDAKALGTLNADGVLEWNNATFGTMANVDAVIRNTFIQGTLSIVFAAAVLVVFVVGLVVCVKAVRAGGLATTEEPDQPSHLFAPAGLFSTSQEKGLAKQWQAHWAQQGGPTPQRVVH
jgi:carbon starvation protein